MEDIRKGYLLVKIDYTRVRDWISRRSLSEQSFFDRRDVGDVNSFTATPVKKKEPSGCKLPGVGLLSMINIMEKVPTRVLIYYQVNIQES